MHLKAAKPLVASKEVASALLQFVFLLLEAILYLLKAAKASCKRLRTNLREKCGAPIEGEELEASSKHTMLLHAAKQFKNHIGERVLPVLRALSVRFCLLGNILHRRG